MIFDDEKSSKAFSYALQYRVEDRLSQYMDTLPYVDRERFKLELVQHRAPVFRAEAQWQRENEKLIENNDDSTEYERSLLYYYGAQLAEYEWLEQYRTQFKESSSWIMIEEEVYTPLILLHKHFVSADGNREEQAIDFVRYAVLLEQPPFVGFRAQDMSHTGFNAFFTLLATKREDIERRERKSKEPDKNIYRLLLQVQDWLNALVEFNYRRSVTNELSEYDGLVDVIRECNQGQQDKKDENQNIFGRILRSIGILNDSRHMIYAFRQFRDRADNGHSLYGELASGMLDFFELHLPSESMVTIDDARDIREDTEGIAMEDFQEDDSMARIGNRAQAISKPLRIHLREEYAIDPTTVMDWHGFQKPSELYIHVPRNQTVVTIKLVYRNEESGEHTDFTVTVDYEQKAFDWSILDKHTRAPCVAMYEDCMRLIETVLVSMNAVERSSRQPQTVFKQPKRTVPNRDPLYDLRRNLHKASNKLATSVQSHEVAEVQAIQHKPIIIHENILQDLPADLLGDIRHTVDRFNERQEFRYKGFKKLETYVDTYSLRVRNYRILLRETLEGYEMLEVKDRKDIYR